MIDEKPILFSAPMVRAILEGRKTATMRPLIPRPELRGRLWWSGNRFWTVDDTPDVEWAPNHVGDLLWIREAWRAWHGVDKEKPSLLYPDGIRPERGLDIWYEANLGRPPDRFGKLRPGIFLPKRFARPERLPVMAVEVARPRLLTATQIEAEGVDPVMVDRMGVQAAWQDLWENSYGHKSWQQNPWCWRYTFELVRP